MTDTTTTTTEVTLNAYQIAARRTAIYPKRNRLEALAYCALGLNGEAGEVAEKVKKMIRDGDDHTAALVHELGDVLWYIANLATELGVTLEEVAAHNLVKLESRQQRNSLHGSGDDR